MFVLSLLCEDELLLSRRTWTGSSFDLCHEALCSTSSFGEYDDHALVGAGHSYAAPAWCHCCLSRSHPRFRSKRFRP